MLAAIDTAARGINAGAARLQDAGERIAYQGAQGDLSGDMVDMMRATREVEANVAVVRTADEMIGTLLDVLA